MTGEKAPWPRRGVYRLPGEQGWMVPSRSEPGAYRHVTTGHTPGEGWWFECTCPRGRQNGPMGRLPKQPPCRHVREVAVAEADDGLPVPPPPRVNPAVFVD